MNFFAKHYETFDYYQYKWLNDAMKEKLHKHFLIHEEDLEDIFSNTQLSKFEIRKNYMYFALQFANGEKNNRVVTQQIHCLVSELYFVVIDEDEFQWVKEFDLVRDTLVNRDNYNTFDLFYELLDISVTQMFKLLQLIQVQVKELESSVFSEENFWNDQILVIQDNKKNIINFKSLLTPLHELLEEMKLKHSEFIDETGKESLDDSFDKIKKLNNRLDNFRDTMKLLTETNELVMARNTNANVRKLTLFNVLLLGPSLVAWFFGMNLHMGFMTTLTKNGSLVPLIIVITIATILTATLYQLFKNKK